MFNLALYIPCRYLRLRWLDCVGSVKGFVSIVSLLRLLEKVCFFCLGGEVGNNALGLLLFCGCELSTLLIISGLYKGRRLLGRLDWLPHLDDKYAEVGLWLLYREGDYGFTHFTFHFAVAAGADD